MESLKKVLPSNIYQQLESQGLLDKLYEAVRKEVEANVATDTLYESYKKYKPTMNVLTEDGTFRRTVTDKLAVSKREFVMVEPLNESTQYASPEAMLADCLLSVARHKDDPKYKTEPVIDFTSEQYNLPDYKINFVKSLGRGEATSLQYVFGYFTYLQEEFFRTR